MSQREIVFLSKENVKNTELHRYNFEYIFKANAFRYKLDWHRQYICLKEKFQR